MTSLQAATSLTFLGWAPKISEPHPLNIIEKVSSVLAYAILWIKSWFDHETAALLKAFEADTEFSNYERLHPLPIHHSLLNMRICLINLSDHSPDPETKNYLMYLDWRSLPEIKRLGKVNAEYLYEKSLSIAPALIQRIHDQMITLRSTLRAHCTQFSRALGGHFLDRQYHHSRQALRASLSDVRDHFTS